MKLFGKKDDAPGSVLILEFGVVTHASYSTDEDSDNITSLGTDKGFVALLGFYSLPLGANVKLVTKGDVGSLENEFTLEDTEVWAEISFAEAIVEANVVSDDRLLEALFIASGKVEQRES
jgi:hypothetical protein